MGDFPFVQLLHEGEHGLINGSLICRAIDQIEPRFSKLPT